MHQCGEDGLFDGRMVMGFVVEVALDIFWSIALGSSDYKIVSHYEIISE